MLADRQSVFSRLICPVSGQSLRQQGDELATEDGAHIYPFVRDLPVLIDFPNSVFDRADITLRSELDVSSLGPLGKLYRSVRSRLFPQKSSTTRNVDFLLQQFGERGGVTRLLVVGGGSIGAGLQPIYACNDVEIDAFDVYFSNKMRIPGSSGRAFR